MNFFVDGGFQQLFNDLNQDLLDAAEVDNHTHAMQMPCYEHLTLKTESSYGYDEFQLYNEAIYENNSPIADYDLFNLNSALCTATVVDENNNNNNNSELQLNERRYTNLNEDTNCSNYAKMLKFLPGHSSDTDTDSDFAEWEHTFLENFIEIPELIDILPEQTPLCNDHCFEFFEESSQNLRLTANTLTNVKTNVQQAKTGDDLISGYPCTFGTCQKVYAKPAHLKAHLRRHLGEKPYICNWPDCTWKFSRSDELARHRRSHSGIKPYKCEYCAKCFARSDHLTKHRKVHERRLLAASKAGKAINGVLPSSVYAVRPGRRRKNQI